MQTSAVLVGEREHVVAESRRAPALTLMLFGAVLLFVVGFLHLPSAHNATHDSRHAAGFPCH